MSADGHRYGDERGGPSKDFRAAWLSVLELAEITVPRKVDSDLKWHDLRHECGSRLAERGVDVRKVQELLGHANITTTQRYFNTSTHAIGQAMKIAMGWWPIPMSADCLPKDSALRSRVSCGGPNSLILWCRRRESNPHGG